MLLDKLYTITSFTASEGGDKITSSILLKGEHPVFMGHFPGNPILPGVCTVQIVLELLEKATGKTLMLNKAGNIKYLGFISPIATPEILFNLTVKNADDGSLNCTAGIIAGGNTVCSFKGEYGPLSR
jgi:3-hydroxyacyl-[acyl-carrier-protein] dehydratase